ncbi:hypothetical protein CU254_02395 [Amycolatopsis sp. AA4]|uniref:hypothetical protein n=1 Tax=Actinomycetes TaxID=1760 RepID=UPI0001B539A9|nr:MULTISPECIES: hypothetical protein [Actinomycetes]ATY09454.1 hypothetical protein CU254_02395 [Amycolatopsis sp. AA4]EFL04792.1 predicted protein [Streptomyces sp. AA4]
MDEEALTALAFGSDAGSSDPIPRDGSPRERLLAAIVLGARGRYAAAADLLDPLRRGRDPLTASLAASTLASHRRQLGAHVAARKLDGEALLKIGLRDAGAPAPTPARAASGGAAQEDPHGLDRQGARADALLGLAADNLALGRISAARRLAIRAAQADRRWRANIRGGWVGAEIELADGHPEAAVAPARLAYETAVARHARRHIVKSGIVLGVALLAAGQDGARELVLAAAADAEKYELDSLSWVATRVAADLDPGGAEEYRFRSHQVLHAVLRHADPCVMRIAHESPWVPVRPG